MMNTPPSRTSHYQAQNWPSFFIYNYTPIFDVTYMFYKYVYQRWTVDVAFTWQHKSSIKRLIFNACPCAKSLGRQVFCAKDLLSQLYKSHLEICRQIDLHSRWSKQESMAHDKARCAGDISTIAETTIKSLKHTTKERVTVNKSLMIFRLSWVSFLDKFKALIRLHYFPWVSSFEIQI